MSTIYSKITQKMKRYTIYLMLLFSVLSFAQNNRKIEKIKAIQVAFISNKLDLTPEEAQKFWPIFNQFSDKQFDLKFKRKMLLMKMNPESATPISDSEMTKLLADSENLETEIQNNRSRLIKDLQGVISPQKIFMLKQLEEEFKKTLLKQFKNREKSRD
jgi:hypothetical protein